MKSNRIGHVLYNFDRMIASAIWDTAQNTISDEVGRIARNEPQVGDPMTKRWQIACAKIIARWLDTDTKIWGVAHTAHAIAHADALDRVDDGREQ